MELAYLKGDYKTGEIVMREWEVGSGDREAEYQERMRARLSWLIAELEALGCRGAVPAELASGLLLLRLQDALLAVSARRAGVPDGAGDMTERAYPPEIVAVMGGREPTEEQWRAISWPLEPFVLVAGAGSGKTSVMAARVVYLALAASGRLDADVPGVLPGNVLCLTFTNKATENLQQRIRHALAGLELAEGEEPEIMNYHGFAAQLLSRYGMLAGIEPDQRVLSPAQRTELCARVMDLMTFEYVKTENQGGVIDNILLLDDQASNHRRTPEEIIAFNEARLEQLQEHRSDRAYRSSLERIELARGAAIFRQLKRDLGAIDFGDQISLALQGGRGAPAGGEPSTGSDSAPCSSTSTRTPTSRRPG